MANMCSYKERCEEIDCKITLQNQELWQKFHQLDTEMIITKSGRRMFPSLRVQITGLEKTTHYCVFLEMVPAANCRFKYSASGGWTPAGAEEAQSPHRVYLHPDSPMTGEHWMTQPVSFSRLKLTNTPTPPHGHLVLCSMHKYQPRIIIARTTNPSFIVCVPSMTASFEETKFIAVTAYQNDKITKLKIDNNPFAKGFRVNGQSKCKRKRFISEEPEPTDAKTPTKSPSPPLEILSSPETVPSSPEPHPSYSYPAAQFYVPYRYPSVFPMYDPYYASVPSPYRYHHYPVQYYSSPYYSEYYRSLTRNIGEEMRPPAQKIEETGPPTRKVEEMIPPARNIEETASPARYIGEIRLPPMRQAEEEKSPRKMTDFSIKAIIGIS